MIGDLTASRTISTATALALARLSATRAAQDAAYATPPAADGDAEPGAAMRASAARPTSHTPDDATLSRVNDALLQRNARAEYSFVEGTQRMVLKLVDTATNEVIRQVPSQEMIDLARRLDDLRGLLVHKVA